MLKGDPATRDIPVVTMTAHAMRGDREKTLDAGCAGYISKPNSTTDLPRTVARLVSGVPPPGDV